MKLNKLSLLPFYNTYDNNIISEFYNPVLNECIYYDRVSAYFDSKVLALYASALQNVYKNNGQVRFIFSYDLSYEDFDLIKQGYQNRKEIENDLLKKVECFSLSDEQMLHFSNLAFLIEIGLVDIKIAFTKTGIFHDKFSLFYDDMNCVYARGSNNETLAAIMYSYESFETTCSWNCSESEKLKIENAQKVFNELWDNKKKNVLVMDIPEIVKSKIISYSAGKMKSIDELSFINKFVLDIDDNKNLISKNFLVPNMIDTRDLVFKVFLKKYITNMSNDNITFKEKLNYAEIRKIKEYLIEYSIDNDFDIYVTDRLNDYLSAMELYLDSRKKLGTHIKNRTDHVVDKFNEFSTIVNTEMHRRLKSMQMWCSYHIVSMIRSANFSVPGSGKTSIVYGAFAYLNRQSDKKIDKIVMIGPKNSFISWKDEFYECFKDKKKLKLLDVQDEKYTNKKRLVEALLYDSGSCNLILVNYEKLQSLTDILTEIIDERTMLVFDEIHKIKSVTGVWANAALHICSGAKYRVALTGTPIPNSFVDLYNILKILFNEEYESFFRFTPSELKNASSYKIDEINSIIFPFYCRITKKDLAIPPPNDPVVCEIMMTSYEKNLFQILRRIYKHNILSLYIRLLQAATNPQLLLKEISENQYNLLMYNEDEEVLLDERRLNDVDGKVIANSDVNKLIELIGETSKYKYGIELLKKLCAENKQVIVWGIFVDTLRNISKSLNVLNISNHVICGATNHEEREELIKKFKNKEYQVLITNPHTLAESVSLHQNCHDAVYFEYSFNLTHMLQSRDRINRLGLLDSDYTQYYYLTLCNDDIYNDSIDKKTLKRLNEKEEIMLQSIEGTRLTNIEFDDIDDIRKILNDI